MSDFHNPSSLEEELRQDQRREAARRRRKRLPWLIPLSLLLIVLGVGLFFLLRDLKKQTPADAETEAPENNPVTIAFVGDIALTGTAQKSFYGSAGYDFSPCFRWVTAENTISHHIKKFQSIRLNS